MARTNETVRSEGTTQLELAQIRKELTQLQRDLATAMRYLTAIAGAVRDIRGFEAQLSTKLPPATVPAHVDANTQRCHVCGSPISHHPAPDGDLLLCPACGWSEFVSRDGHETAEVRPESVPPCGEARNWAA